MAEWTDHDNPHIPQIEVVENEVYISRLGYCNVYKMPKYNKCPHGNKIVNRMIAINKNISDSWEYRQTALNCWYEASRMIVDAMQADEILPNSIKDAIEDIHDSTTNYGYYALEFFKRNIMQDDDGNIILLDIAFNPKALR